jgi:integrase
MLQQGQVFRLSGGDGRDVWAFRYRVGGRGSRRVQRGGFASERDASEALERALERVRRERGCGSALTLGELVDEYLAQHDGEPETVEKLRWLLTKPVKAFGARRLPELRSQEIAAWRISVPPGHRFEATQALRQVLARAVLWGMIDVNPAKQGVDNPQRRHTEKRPFESWAELASVAAELGSYSGPMVMFAAATGLRPGGWIALEQRDIDRDARVVYVRRAYRNGRLKCTKTEASVRAVPLQTIALAALEQLPANTESVILFPSARRGHLDLHNFRNRDWKPAQRAAGITPLRRVYDLRHTFATLRPSCRHLHLRPFPLHGRQLDDDRPPLRPSGPRRPRPRDQPPRRLHRLRKRRRPRRGRCVDIGSINRRRLGQRKDQLSRKKPEAL